MLLLLLLLGSRGSVVGARFHHQPTQWSIFTINLDISSPHQTSFFPSKPSLSRLSFVGLSLSSSVFSKQHQKKRGRATREIFVYIYRNGRRRRRRRRGPSLSESKTRCVYRRTMTTVWEFFLSLFFSAALFSISRRAIRYRFEIDLDVRLSLSCVTCVCVYT